MRTLIGLYDRNSHLYRPILGFSKLINRTVYAPMLRHFGTTNTVPKCPRHFGTSAEMSWVRSVLGPKCPYTLCYGTWHILLWKTFVLLGAKA